MISYVSPWMCIYCKWLIMNYLITLELDISFHPQAYGRMSQDVVNAINILDQSQNHPENYMKNIHTHSLNMCSCWLYGFEKL